MANRQLTPNELQHLFKPLIVTIREELVRLAHGDTDLHWALRRKLAKELIYDERSRPGDRVKLKAFKRGQQNNKCAICACDLPEKYAILERLEAMKGYTPGNTRLICRDCDERLQKDRRYK